MSSEKKVAKPPAKKNVKSSGKKVVPATKKKPQKIYVQTGRLAYLQAKKYATKLAVIVNVIDQNRALCDIFNPHGRKLRFLNRASVQFSTMRLTKFMVPGIFHNSHSKLVIAKMAEHKILQQFQETSFYKAWQKKYLRDQMTDYDRFKCSYVKILRKKVINDKLKELRRAKRKKPAPVVKKAPKPKRLSVKAKEKLANHVAIRKATAAKKAAAKAKKPKAKKAATPAKKA